jgi:Fur family ferric uptake transcriptional regulator
MSRADAIQQLLQRHLNVRGLKRTRQRERILEALLELPGHVTMDQLARRVASRHPGIGQATVYRSVKLFEEAGILERHSLQGGQPHYELVTPRDEHHDHLLCITCGRIFEFRDPVIEARQEALASQHGLRILSHSHVIRGECVQPERCEDCVHCHPANGKKPSS